MTADDLLQRLAKRVDQALKDLRLPVNPDSQRGKKAEPRAPATYLMRVKTLGLASLESKVPYVMHQVVEGSDIQKEGEDTQCRVQLRSVFAVYNKDEEEGALRLLEMMERVRIDLLKNPILDSMYELDLEEGLERLIYPDDMAPYYAGEMNSVWKVPRVVREVRKWL